METLICDASAMSYCILSPVTPFVQSTALFNSHCLSLQKRAPFSKMTDNEAEVEFDSKAIMNCVCNYKVIYDRNSKDF